MFKRSRAAHRLLAASVFWAAVFLWHSNLTPPRCQEYQQPSIAPTQNGHASAAASKAKQPSERQKEEKWYNKFLDHLPDWFVAMFTGLLVYVTFRLVRATSDLRDSTDKLWQAGELQIAIAKEAADAAQKSASAAIVSANTAKKSVEAAINVERPLLYIKTPDISFERPTVVEAKIAIVNLGRTPAILRSKAIRMGLLSPYTEEPIYGKSFSLHEYVLNEKQEMSDLGVYCGTDEFVKGKVFIYGRIDYEDVFGIRREVGFCFGWRTRKGHVLDRLERIGGPNLNYDRINKYQDEA